MPPPPGAAIVDRIQTTFGIIGEERNVITLANVYRFIVVTFDRLNYQIRTAVPNQPWFRNAVPKVNAVPNGYHNPQFRAELRSQAVSSLK